MSKRKINLISALTVKHESARVVFWNYVKKFLEIKFNDENVILVDPHEYPRMIESLGENLIQGKTTIYKMTSNGRFLDRLIERRFVQNNNVEVKSF